VACKTASSASSHATAQVEQQTDASGKVTTTETVTSGPETVTTTTEEYGLEDASPRADAPVGPRPAPATGPGFESGEALATVRRRGPLVKRTVVVDQRSPAVAVTRAEGTTATETRTEVKTDTQAQTAHSNAPSGLFGSLLGLWPLLLLAILALAGWIGWRVLRARVP